MKDASGRVLYIGKAKNLRVRLRQYASGADTRAQVAILLPQVVDIDTIVALTEKDALILENQLIKRYLPKYNVLLKDDKTYVSLLVTQHKWPMIRLIRYKGKPKDKGMYFGPYTNALAARHIFDLIARLFPLRQCSDAELMQRERPCLLYDIKRCLAPCVNKCTEEEYDLHVQSVVELLKGRDKELVRALKGQMQLASDALEFEKAAALKYTIEQIEHVTSVAHTDNPEAKECDVIGLYREGTAVLIALLSFREGKLTASEHFSFHQIVSEEEEIISSFLLQHYQETPKEILVPVEISETVGEILNTTLIAPKKGRKKELLLMAEKNAKALFVREQDQRSLKEKMLLELQEALQLTRFPRRIDCFDTSNTVASCASFLHGEKDKSRTRHFKIKGATDDYAALREALTRHFSKKDFEFCDLLVVDGGKGQLNVALDVLDALSIATVDVIALTKQDARHDKGMTEERIFVPYRKDPIVFDVKSPLLFILQRIRDEAHRQSIQFHRKTRAKTTMASALDDIPGIGPVKRKQLLKTFGSVKAIREATIEELKTVVSEKDAHTLRNRLGGSDAPKH